MVPLLCGSEAALIVGSRPVVDRAECLVVDQLGDAGVVAAHRAGRVAADFEGAETHGQGVVYQQSADEEFALTEDQFDGFSGLNQANGASTPSETGSTTVDKCIPEQLQNLDQSLARGNSPAFPTSVPAQIPHSVIRPVTSRAGVTSKA